MRRKTKTERMSSHHTMAGLIERLGNGFGVDSSGTRIEAQVLFEEVVRVVYRLLCVEIAYTQNMWPLLASSFDTGFSLRDIVLSSTQKKVSIWSCVCEVMDRICIEKQDHTGGGIREFFWNASLFSHLWSGLCSDKILKSCMYELADFVQENAITARSLGAVYEHLLLYTPQIEKSGRFVLTIEKQSTRKKTGAYYTPKELVSSLLDRTLRPIIDHVKREGTPQDQEAALLNLRVCDPTCGSGVFLIAAADMLTKELLQIQKKTRSSKDVLCKVLTSCIYGLDINPLSVDICILLMWRSLQMDARSLMVLKKHIRHGHGLLGKKELSNASTSISRAVAVLEKRYSFFDWQDNFSDVFERENPGFDCMIGNPPWISFSGRHAQALSSEEKVVYQHTYKVFSGWLALHSLFVERSIQLTREKGMMGLVLPQQLAYLTGYATIRMQIRLRSIPHEPMLDFGERCFDDVSQSSFGLVVQKEGQEHGSSAPFILASSHPYQEIIEHIMKRLQACTKPPKEMFRDLGIHTGNCAKELVSKEKKKGYIPLYEGKDVFPFRVREPQKWLRHRYQKKKGEYYTIRSLEAYSRVRILIRQTANRPIAAKHIPRHCFRNSILACYGHSLWEDEKIVAWLNSTVVAFFHLNSIAESQQYIFPQVKISHLRNLPMPDFLADVSIDVSTDIDEQISMAFGFSSIEHQKICSLYAYLCVNAELKRIHHRKKKRSAKLQEKYDRLYKKMQALHAQLHLLQSD